MKKNFCISKVARFRGASYSKVLIKKKTTKMTVALGIPKPRVQLSNEKTSAFN